MLLLFFFCVKGLLSMFFLGELDKDILMLSVLLSNVALFLRDI